MGILTFLFGDLTDEGRAIAEANKAEYERRLDALSPKLRQTFEAECSVKNMFQKHGLCFGQQRVILDKFYERQMAMNVGMPQPTPVTLGKVLQSPNAQTFVERSIAFSETGQGIKVRKQHLEVSDSANLGGAPVDHSGPEPTIGGIPVSQIISKDPYK